MKRILLAAALLAAGSSPLWAHDEGSSSSEIRVSGKEVTWAIDVGTLGLQRFMDLGAPPHKLREKDLEPFRERIARFVAAGFALQINGRDVTPEPVALEALFEEIPPTDIRVLAKVRQTFRFRSEEEVERIALTYRLFADVVPNHRSVLAVAWGDQTREFVLSGRSDLKLRAGTLDPRWWSPAASFFGWGIHHIFLGVDHIVFLLALLLGARRLRDIVKVATSFTAAHSLTLLLSALDVIRIPVRVTESLIAISIIYVAVENHFLKDGRHRWMPAFGFGLVHGLGFSSSLRDLLTDRILVPVLAFNAGIEAGQLAILSVAYPVLRALQRSPDETVADGRRRRLVLAGSVPILLLGFGWLIERACGLAFMPV
jgi:hydrogenase/urease accessory protein HupE